AVNVHVTAPTGQLKVGVKCSWTKPAFAFVRDYEVQWSPAGQNQWTGYIATEPTDTLEGLVEGDVIDIRVRTVANWGSASDWLTLTNHTVTAKAIPPGGPSSLSVTGGYRRLNLGWNLPGDPDVKETEIYVSPTNDLNNAFLLAKVAAPSTFYRHAVDPSVTNYYWIRCKDTSGNYSVWYPTNTTGIGATSSSFDYGDFSGELPMFNMPDGVNNDLLTYNQIRNPGLFGVLADFNEADWSMHVANRPTNLSGLSGIETIRNDSLIPNDLLSGAGWSLMPESGATLGATALERRILQNSKDIFYQTFDTDEQIAEWIIYIGDPPFRGSTSFIRRGGGCIVFGDNAGNDKSVAIHPDNIPFDPDLLYSITFYIRQPLGTGPCYLGIAGVSGDGFTAVNVNGSPSFTSSQHYVAASGVSPGSGGFTKYTGWFKGHSSSGVGGQHNDPKDPATLHSDVRFFRPLIFCNWNDSAGAFQCDAVIVKAFDYRTMNNVHTTIISPNALRESVGIDQGDGVVRRAPFGLGAGYIRDAGSYTFPTPFNTPPVIKFRGGVTYSTTLTGKQNLVSKAINVSSSGFDASLRIKELAGGSTLNTDTSGTSNVDGMDFVKHKSQSAQAWDDNYQFQIDVTINNIYNEEFDTWFPGSVTVGYYTNDGSGWVKRGEKTFSGNNYSSSQTHLNDEHTITVDGLSNHAGHEFAVDVISVSSAGGSITAFDNVKYYTATAPNDETGTPTGAEDAPFELLAGE
ncbi:MAG: hypothetical protein OQJ95_01010, partial [Kangiella sp.]|nr:hypothetical protein [Kangiella sp.]